MEKNVPLPVKRPYHFLIVGFSGIVGVATLVIFSIWYVSRTPARDMVEEEVSSAGTEVATSSVQGVTDTRVVIGSSAALSGPAAQLGLNYVTYGADIAVREINDQGGIGGRKIKFITYDDKYEPAQAILNTQRLIVEDEVFALSSYVGTPTGVVVLPIVAEHKVPLVGLFTGAEAFRKPLQEYVFNIRASYYEEAEAAVQYFVDNRKFSKIAVFYQNDAFGKAVLTGAELALKKRNLNVVATSTYERNTMEVEAAVQALRSLELDAVIMVGTYDPLAKFVRLMKENKPDMLFHTVSFVGPEAYAKALGEDTRNVFVTQVVLPPYYSHMFDGLNRYRQVLEKYYPDVAPTFGGLEGYISMRVLIEGIARAGENLTREGLVGALETMTYHDTSIGSPVTFSPNNHQALHQVFLTTLVGSDYVIVPVR